MSESAQVQDETPIAIAVQHINAGELDTADACLKSLLARDTRHAVALYLSGFIACEQQRFADAEASLRAALRESPAQLRIVVLLARTLRISGRASEAALLCRRAPQHSIETLLETAACEEAAGNRDAAENIFRVLSRQTTAGSVTLAFAQFLLRAQRSEEAEQLVRAALKAPSLPDDSVRAQLEHQLGLSLKLQHRHADAISAMRQAASRGLADRACTLEYAGLAAHAGEFDEAIGLYEAHLQRNPLDLETHSLLNDLYHAAEKRECVGQSYDQALARAPKAVGLSIAKGRLFLSMNDPAKAETAFRAALEIAPGDAAAKAGLGLALDRSGDKTGARAAHAENIAAHPEDGAALEAFGSFLLGHGDAEASAEMLRKAVRIRPDSQSAIATLGLAYRACEDRRERWLNDYERDVQIFDLEPPPGFSNMAAFNEELAAHLRSLHTHARQYPSQTLRGGTQTYDGIFYRGHKPVDILLGRINDAVRTYGGPLGGRGEHPLASRLSGNFRHAGSWSSCLRDRGYHVNHIHQKGWISSCYYVSLPDVVNDRDARQGWLKFGEPPAEFGLDWGPRKAVQPVVGRLVLFPSYMWHGTVAFHSARERITIAFDTVPA